MWFDQKWDHFRRNSAIDWGEWQTYSRVGVVADSIIIGTLDLANGPSFFEKMASLQSDSPRKCAK